MANGQKLAGGGEEIGLGEDGVEEAVADTQQGGSNASGVRIIFKAVIQAVLLFEAYRWVVAPRMGTVLEGFQTQVVRRLTVQLPRRTTDET